MISLLSNKNGQVIGRKGMETRQRLMEGARRLLAGASPFELTAVSISKEAGVRPATFYVYFDDVQDVLFALSRAAGLEFVTLLQDEHLFDEPDKLESDAHRFIALFNGAWDRHSPILLYRNLEADRGDLRFYDLRIESALPIVETLAFAIARTWPPGHPADLVESHAEAVVLFAAIERMAATTHQNTGARDIAAQLLRAQANVMVRLLQPR